MSGYFDIPPPLFSFLPVLNTQLPHSWLEYLPDVLYEQRYVSMFPFEWHLVLNWVSFISCLVAVGFCVYHQHWLMQAKPLDSIGIKQFMAYLCFHGGFYIVELVVSDMCIRYTAMAYHHLVALGIFTLFFFEPGSVCVFSIIPFLFHCNFWVFYQADSQFQLFLYNLSLFIVGLVSLSMYVASRGRRVSWRIPLLCIVEVAVNYYNYCWDFNGWYCPYTNGVARDRRLGLILVIGGLTLASMGIALVVGNMFKTSPVPKKSIKRQKAAKTVSLKEE